MVGITYIVPGPGATPVTVGMARLTDVFVVGVLDVRAARDAHRSVLVVFTTARTVPWSLQHTRRVSPVHPPNHLPVTLPVTLPTHPGSAYSPAVPETQRDRVIPAHLPNHHHPRISFPAHPSLK